MAWLTPAHLLRDLAAWEHRNAPYGGHWPWDRDLLDLPGDPRAVTISVRGTPTASIGGHRVSVRRALWEAVWGTLPGDVNVLATCVEATCVRPAHGHVALEIGRALDRRRQRGDTPALQRWDAAWPGPVADRRGRILVGDRLLGADLPHGERRMFGASMAAATVAAAALQLDYAGMGEHPGHLR